MSKIVNLLTPQDFGKSLDAKLFSQWKESIDAHERASVISIVLYAAGFLLMMVLGGFIGIGLFFTLAFIGIGIALPKQNKRKRYQRELGISNSDFRKAVTQCRERTR